MSEPEVPQLYLISPPEIDPAGFAETLAHMLEAVPIACIRLALATNDEARIIRAADAVREVAHGRDVPLVLDNHYLLAARLGLDGVHLTDGARRIRKARAELGADAIVGAFCGNLRHEGLSAGEAGADYVSFGPIGASVLGDGSQANPDLFQWWSEMIEIPVVAEGALDPENLRALAPFTDFFALGEEVWRADDPVAELARLAAVIAG